MHSITDDVLMIDDRFDNYLEGALHFSSKTSTTLTFPESHTGPRAFIKCLWIRRRFTSFVPKLNTNKTQVFSLAGHHTFLSAIMDDIEAVDDFVYLKASIPPTDNIHVIRCINSARSALRCFHSKSATAAASLPTSN